jgi:nucleotide-binding universal stress UspA family protein
MKNLLAVIDAGREGQVLEAAVLAARRFNSHITAMSIAPSEQGENFGLDSVLSIYSKLKNPNRSGDQGQHDARSNFRKFMIAHGVALGVADGEHQRPTASWSSPRQKLSVGMIGRSYDLIIMGQPQNLASTAGATFEDALFESGRPVLIAPKEIPRVLGDTIGVAWNGSAETAQTVALAMPFLKRAKRVAVIAVGDQDMPEPGPEGEELARMLIQEGMTVSLHWAAGRQTRQGESFLHEAKVLGVDLLLKGAYTRSRLRQAIFGGATRHIILKSAIPVLMAR